MPAFFLAFFAPLPSVQPILLCYSFCNRCIFDVNSPPLIWGEFS